MKTLPLLLLLCFLAWSPPAGAFQRSQLQQAVVFGDSLSDNGNTFALDKIPKPPYYLGRWTDGPNWVDYFAKLAAFPKISAFSANGGTNFAVGGASSEELQAEIAAFLSAHGGRASATDLYIIWIGANDFSNQIPYYKTVNFILAGIFELRLAGAQNILVLDIPDISLTPNVIAKGPFVIQAAKAFVAAANAELQAKAVRTGQILGIDVELVDINLLFTEIVYNPAVFGFSNSIAAAYNPSTGQIVQSPNTYVFWDGFHPTTSGHRLAASFVTKRAALAGAPPILP